MRPNGLDALTVRQPDSVHQCDVVPNLTGADVSHKMELSDTTAEADKFRKVNVVWWEVGEEPALEVYTPLACNIVSNIEATETGLEGGKYSRKESEVAVHLSRKAMY